MKLLFRMTPKGAFYTGSNFPYGSFCPFPQSDTLFQAVGSAWKVLWGEKNWEKITAQFLSAKEEQDLPFFVSSIFPVIQDVYFLPRCPVLTDHSPELKNVRWVSAPLYRQWLEGSNVSTEKGLFLAPGVFCDTQSAARIGNIEPKTLWQDGVHMRTRLQHTQSPEVFAAHKIYFHPRLEFYFLVGVQDNLSRQIQGAMRLLADEGIGGRRSTGCGSFTFHPGIAIPEILKFVNEPIKNRFITLSLYQPHHDDVKKGVLRNARYELTEKQGWQLLSTGNSVPRQTIRMLSEGSYFDFSSALNMQSLVNVGENREEPSYTYVYPFRMTAI